MGKSRPSPNKNQGCAPKSCVHNLMHNFAPPPPKEVRAAKSRSLVVYVSVATHSVHALCREPQPPRGGLPRARDWVTLQGTRTTEPICHLSRICVFVVGIDCDVACVCKNLSKMGLDSNGSSRAVGLTKDPPHGEIETGLHLGFPV